MSRYDVLAKRPTALEKIGAEKALATTRRGNPDYRQFSAYIPIDLHRTLKVRLAQRELELSEAVEQALRDWLTKDNP
jgi:hypothetical protein